LDPTLIATTKQTEAVRSGFSREVLYSILIKEVGLEICIEETKYMLLSRHQNIGKSQDIKIANRAFENVSV
jgi:hypothetical protein